MGIKKTLGGNRLGSGKQMQVELKAYQRSSHNLSYDWKSSMACGVLVPFMKLPNLNGDTFDIDLNALVKTKPTIAPLFGSFKMQIDLFSVPIRLYNGLLHNNAINLGMKMNQVLLPKYEMGGNIVTDNSSLLKYLGLSGTFIPKGTHDLKRSFNAVPLIAYYDIFKTYYANKQETNAYQIAGTNSVVTQDIGKVKTGADGTFENYATWSSQNYTPQSIKIYIDITEASNLDLNHIYLNDANTGSYEAWTSIADFRNGNAVNNLWSIAVAPNQIVLTASSFLMYGTSSIAGNKLLKYDVNYTIENTGITLQEFPLENIDKMRIEILKNTELNNSVTINEESMSPYSNAVIVDNGRTSAMQGLCVKTYQSDLFNNWLSSETFEGMNGIAQLSAVDVSSGNLTMDALNLSQKVYNMLNMISAAGGTYEDWQEAKWGTDAMRRAETPVYEGGASYEIAFEELVSTAETETTEGGAQPLGTLAGKGNTFAKRGGKVTIKTKEPSYVMGIVSITPRIAYSQGNDWDITELKSLEDLHSPELDGIGFQNLIEEQMAWWTTQMDTEGNIIQKSAGKQPAWINYMTNISKVYGDFAEENKAGFMVLDRKYERDGSSIADLTTYIDPIKYNGAFADGSLTAQNFWVQIAVEITARRKMSAKLIPTM